ncbi:MAG: BON domain-containing protein [Methylococcaceae bacterium]
MMDKLNLIMRFLMGLLLILSLMGCAGSKSHESTGEYFDDVVISSKVRTKILGDSMLKVMQIDVETFKGTVQLSGFVDSANAANRAEELARKVRGVKMVNNSLIVK